MNLALICSALIVTFWLFSIWVVYWPTPSLDEELEDLILANTGLHAPELAFLGVSLKVWFGISSCFYEKYSYFSDIYCADVHVVYFDTSLNVGTRHSYQLGGI